MKTPVNVAITGGAGQIGYALAFRVASGQMLGPDQPVNLHLLEITPALGALQGVLMELNDCAFPTLNRTVATDDGFVALSRSRTLEYLWGRECPNLHGRGFAALATLQDD